MLNQLTFNNMSRKESSYEFTVLKKKWLLDCEIIIVAFTNKNYDYLNVLQIT